MRDGGLFGMVATRQIDFAKNEMSQQSITPSTADEPSFEEAMARLDGIVQEMEEERLPLEQMVRTYEEGVRLLAQCRARIENARQRVERINNMLDGSGDVSLAHFDVPAEGETETAGSAMAGPASRPGGRRTKETKEAANEPDDDIRLF